MAKEKWPLQGLASEGLLSRWGSRQATAWKVVPAYAVEKCSLRPPAAWLLGSLGQSLDIAQELGSEAIRTLVDCGKEIVNGPDVWVCLNHALVPFAE